jgi:cell division protein FtsW
MGGRKLAFDPILLLTAVGLTVFGLVMVGSASQFTTLGQEQGAFRFLSRQAAYALVGLAMMVVLMRIDYRRYNSRLFMGLVLAVTTILLLVVLFMPPINGAHRWIRIGPVHLQVSEFAKLALVLFLAYTLERKGEEMADVTYGVVPTTIVCGVLSGLVLIEPDTGTAALMGLITLIFLFLAGTKLKVLAAMGGGAAVLLAGVIISSDYKRDRVLTFLNPSADPLGSGFHIIQSLIALGNGGLTGVGLGQGQQKAFYLPLPYSDFIFSVIGEELGMIGTIGVLVLFGLIGWRGLRAAWGAPDTFGLYLGLALTLLLLLQAILNTGVAVGLLPTKGLTLPFISYGGSSLLAGLAATGVLLNISQHSN